MKPKKKIDQDYIRLDDAIAAFHDWRSEIIVELEKKSVSWKAFSEVMDAARRVHSPEDEGGA